MDGFHIHNKSPQCITLSKRLREIFAGFVIVKLNGSQAESLLTTIANAKVYWSKADWTNSEFVYAAVK